MGNRPGNVTWRVFGCASTEPGRWPPLSPTPAASPNASGGERRVGNQDGGGFAAGLLSLAFAFSMPGLAPFVGAAETWLGDVRQVESCGTRIPWTAMEPLDAAVGASGRISTKSSRYERRQAGVREDDIPVPAPDPILGGSLVFHIANPRAVRIGRDGADLRARRRWYYSAGHSAGSRYGKPPL